MLAKHLRVGSDCAAWRESKHYTGQETENTLGPISCFCSMVGMLLKMIIVQQLFIYQLRRRDRYLQLTELQCGHLWIPEISVLLGGL